MRTTCLAVGLLVATLTPFAISGQIEVVEATITDLQAAMEAGRVTSADLVRAHLARIAAYDQGGPRLNAMIRINPRALADAEALDRERASQGPRGPLHGIPVVLKDNYDMVGMHTTAGSIGLAGMHPPDDAFQVRRLREAGAVILGKSNMHEMASGITTIASLGGQTLNPYDPSRNPGGSSGGTGAAIAASYAVVGWGSDTCGSIRIPAAHNNLVGLRPTKGLSSIDGIVPLSSTQDVGGPLARTITDLAIALDATVGRDPADAATEALEGRSIPRFVDALRADALGEARIGVLDAYFGPRPEDRAAVRLVRAAVEKMEELGAEIVEIEIPGLDSLIAGVSLIQHEFKWDLIDYLAGVPDAPAASLTELLERGLIHEALVGSMRRRILPESRETEASDAARARREPLRDAVVAVLDGERLDALVYPTLNRPPAYVGDPQRGSNCLLSPATGMPALTVPAGLTSGGLPIGLELLGRPFDDARLVALGYAFEQATDHRHAPYSAPALVNGAAPAPVRFTLQATGEGMSPPLENGVVVGARMVYDPVGGTLGYQLEVSGVAAEEVHAVALRHQNEEGDWSVTRRLSGPGLRDGSGVLPLNRPFRQRLLAGELFLEVFTRDDPSGAARVRVEIPDLARLRRPFLPLPPLPVSPRTPRSSGPSPR